MSSSVMPEVFRNFWKSSSFGKDCFFVGVELLLDLLVGDLDVLLVGLALDPLREMRNCRTWSLQAVVLLLALAP